MEYGCLHRGYGPTARRLEARGGVRGQVKRIWADKLGNGTTSVTLTGQMLAPLTDRTESSWPLSGNSRLPLAAPGASPILR